MSICTYGFLVFVCARKTHISTAKSSINDLYLNMRTRLGSIHFRSLEVLVRRLSDNGPKERLWKGKETGTGTMVGKKKESNSLKFFVNELFLVVAVAVVAVLFFLNLVVDQCSIK